MGLSTKNGSFSPWILGFLQNLFRGYYLTTSLLPKAGMMIVIVEKPLNVSHGLAMVGAQGFMVQNALSLVNYAENKIKIFQFVPRISNSTYVDTW